MPDICRTYCCLVKICPFANNSFHSWSLFTERSSSPIQMHAWLRSCFPSDFFLYQWLFWTRLLMPFWICWAFSFILFCFINSDWWEFWAKLFTANISSFLLFLNVQPGHIVGKVPLLRHMCTCKQYPNKLVLPNKAFQYSFWEINFNACELEYYLDWVFQKFPLPLSLSQAVSHKPNLSLHIVILKIFP